MFDEGSLRPRIELHNCGESVSELSDVNKSADPRGSLS